MKVINNYSTVYTKYFSLLINYKKIIEKSGESSNRIKTPSSKNPSSALVFTQQDTIHKAGINKELYSIITYNKCKLKSYYANKYL